jgi:NAD(P)-dependent dehydrogenase (short-subunit alcohol dehydrogenase family)
MLGHGIAKRLAQAGASVTIVGRTERGIVDELNEVSPAGATHTFVPVNAYLLSSVNTAVEAIVSTHDKIDYLVQSQGPCLYKRAHQIQNVFSRVSWLANQFV